MNREPIEQTLAEGSTPGSSDASGMNPLFELLVQWEEHRASGDDLSAEQLCPDNLALQAELRERLVRRRVMLAAIDFAENNVGEASQRAPSPLPQLAGYEIEGVIGQGGMGVVYKARQLGLKRLVAIKMILAGANASSQELARFRSEAEAVARLAHSNIAQIFEIGQQQGRPYLALEYVSGGSLAQQLDGQPVPQRRAAELTLALARGVQHAHDKGIVHRDLKPGNVLIHSDGTPKIADFGLAKHVQGNPTHTMTGAIIGSPTYMAPEQAAGNSAEIGPATDIYALGVILYEMITGKPPFTGDSVIETIQQVREQDPLPPRLVQPKLHRDLETICLKCLEKKPQQRYSSAAALAADLKAYLEGEPIQAQSLTLLDQVARSIRHQGFDERIYGFANRMLYFAPVPITVHAIAYLLLAGQPYYAIGMILTTATMLLTMLPLLIFLGYPSLRQIPSWQRKHFMTTWIGHSVAMGVILAIVLLGMRHEKPESMLIIYAMWAVAAALSFLSHAVEAGIYYMIGGAMLVMAIVFALTPTWAPLEVAVLMSANMLFQGLYLRTQSRESGDDPVASEKIAAATTMIPPK
ncbi:Serine/threonine-protein kinase PknB [Anatilimnocola aggregata]|uniref:non-specific serine/threonine protein kinase n=1 Tax=Anatilimnocola aggregata TaxID=2528021 RepID=A0A517YIV5_9BACT|nr:serine/threonine-protein kinase [Anatilimnocola aggregata]QDU30156.1 Serine/threonine-protein kinase PknB [Anatilimnocola aggregata]